MVDKFQLFLEMATSAAENTNELQTAKVNADAIIDSFTDGQTFGVIYLSIYLVVIAMLDMYETEYGYNYSLNTAPH